MPTLKVRIPDDVLSVADAKAAAANVSRDEYMTRALEHYANIPGGPVAGVDVARDLDAFFANAADDAGACEQQVAENGRRTLRRAGIE